MITIVGLGTEQGDLTEKGKKAVLSADKVLLRTGKARSSENVFSLGVEYETLDYVYETSRSFTTLNKKLAKAVFERAKGINLVYCVDGTPQEDRSAELIVKRDKKITLISGVSKAQKALETAKMTALSAFSCSAYDVESLHLLALPAVIYDLDNEFLAGDLKEYLSDKVGEEEKITFIHGGKAKKIYIYELDRQKEYDYTTCVVVDEKPLLEKKRFDVQDLKDIITRLRRPDGCPWDKVQTPESIRSNLVEEAYELVDAIDEGDSDKIREETGDVLLQAVFHAVMQEERGNFNLTDSLSELCEKLIFRHSHIFGQDKATDEGSALSVWEKNKAIEKGQDTFSKAVNDVPKVFPACMRAQKVQKRAGKSGFDFDGVLDAKEKLQEELLEFEQAYASGDSAHTSEELGDLLFATVCLGRKAGVDCEQALKDSTEKYVKRFNALEKLITSEGKDVTKLTKDELLAYYKRVK